MSDSQSEDIQAIIQEIRDRVRARYPQGDAQGIGCALPDLLPILHARDAAEAKVAAIGNVNPRPSGLVNNLIQAVKRSVARTLGWFVRDQIEFNRSVLVALEATLESLNDVNRTFTAVGSRLDEVRSELRDSTSEARELKDIRSHWVHWREEWEKKLFQNELHYLKSVQELQAAFESKLLQADARMLQTEASYRDLVRAQHAEFTEDIRKAVDEVHKRFWADLDRIRTEYEQLIHHELREIRQKTFAAAAMPRPAQPAEAPAIDYVHFANRFRGTEDDIRDRLRFYLSWFRGRSAVLDIGCGRGEFLEVMREAGVEARGVDLDEESVAICRAKGLEAEVADAFDLLREEPAGAFDAIFAAQVVEHLQPHQVPQLVRDCAAKLKPGGVLALETPNPECLAIFATHFYLDPTHTRPLPPALMAFYFEEFGFGRIEVHRLSPAGESIPSVNELPPAFRETFFGGLDYCIIGRRL